MRAATRRSPPTGVSALRTESYSRSSSTVEFLGCSRRNHSDSRRFRIFSLPVVSSGIGPWGCTPGIARTDVTFDHNRVPAAPPWLTGGGAPVPPPSPDNATGDDVNSPASEAQPPISTPPAGQVAAGPVAADPGAGGPGAGKPVAGGPATGHPATREHGEPSGPANDQAPAPLPPNAPRPQWVPEPEDPHASPAWEPSPYPAPHGPTYPNAPVAPTSRRIRATMRRGRS